MPKFPRTEGRGEAQGPGTLSKEMLYLTDSPSLHSLSHTPSEFTLTSLVSVTGWQQILCLQCFLTTTSKGGGRKKRKREEEEKKQTNQTPSLPGAPGLRCNVLSKQGWAPTASLHSVSLHEKSDWCLQPKPGSQTVCKSNRIPFLEQESHTYTRPIFILRQPLAGRAESACKCLHLPHSVRAVLAPLKLG